MNTQVRHINLFRHHIKYKYKTQRSCLSPINTSFMQTRLGIPK